ncbi:MAG: patatin-like phospholipase family protein [Clostridiales bacterium]|jgi:NTE family protein|nr:patatin-like phospholipase family protein [Clostridiales bacterium]
MKNMPFQNVNQQLNQPNIALVLGGGGARGFAHIGALRAFEEAGIEFDFVVGTSVGAFVGACYAVGTNTKRLLELAETINLREIHNGFWLVPNNATRIGNVLSRFIGDHDIENLKRRFVAIATDIKVGRQHIMERGDLASAISASCCVPVAFRPVIREGFHLVDGGLLNNIPADVAKMMGATHVVSIDINPTRGGGTTSLKTFEVLKATLSIITSNSSVAGLLKSDIIIEPDLSKYRPTSKDGYLDMIRIGYDATIEKIDDILNLIKNTK